MRKARSLGKFRVPVIDIAIETNVQAQEKTVATIHCGVGRILTYTVGIHAQQ